MIITRRYETLRFKSTGRQIPKFEIRKPTDTRMHRNGDLVSAKSRSRATSPPGASSGRTTFTKWPAREFPDSLPKSGCTCTCTPLHLFHKVKWPRAVCLSGLKRVWLSGDFLRVHAWIRHVAEMKNSSDFFVCDCFVLTSGQFLYSIFRTFALKK